MPELVEQLGIMRYGRRPRFADTFSSSGQIPFEAARLGCDVDDSDLNPFAYHAHLERVRYRWQIEDRAGKTCETAEGTRRQTTGRGGCSRNRDGWQGLEGACLSLRCRSTHARWMDDLCLYFLANS